jgi:hypothetical protein
MFGQDYYSISNAFQNIQNSLTGLSNRISTLSSSLIPKINLPIYLQNYTFSSGGVLTPYFNIVGGLTTNGSLNRTWNLVTAGTLSTAINQIIFTYDFSDVASTYSVSIDGSLAGTFTINGQVYDAATYFATPTYVRKILTLTLNLSQIPQNSNGGDFSFILFIADASSNSYCSNCIQAGFECVCLQYTNGGQCVEYTCSE